MLSGDRRTSKLKGRATSRNTKPADKADQREFPYGWQVGAKVCGHARQYGVILRPLADVVVLFPPLSISLASLEQLMQVVARCIDEVLAELPAGEADGYEG